MPAPSPTSLIDEVNDHDQVVGRIRRDSALAPGRGFRTVHVFIVVEGQILLQELAPSRERHAGLWGSSVAGYLHAGEDYAEGARRRQREELGVVAPLEEIGKTRMSDMGAEKFVALFLSRATEAKNAAPDEIAALKWWAIPDLVAMMHGHPERFTPTFLALVQEFGLGGLRAL